MSATKNAENVWNHLNTQFVNHLCYSSLTSHQFILIELKIGEGNHSLSYSSVARWSRLGIGLTELGIDLRIINARRTVWPCVSGLNFYDLNELFIRGCSFPISSISRLHELYWQNMRIIRFRLCPDGYSRPRLAKIINCISVFSTSIFSRVHATLQPALSVRPSVGPSVHRSVGPSVRPSHFTFLYYNVNS